MIAYIAACPSCARDCWWHSYPVRSDFDSHSPQALLRIACSWCDTSDRERAAQQLLIQQSVRGARVPAGI